MSERRARSFDAWRGAAGHLLAWLPAAAMCFYVKQRLLEMHGYRIVARSLGRVEMGDLSAAEKLTFFREDTLLALVAVPSLALVLLRLLRPVWRGALVAAASIAVYVVLFIQMRTFDEVGRFASLPVLVSAWHFAVEQPGAADQYIDARSIIKVVVPCLAIVALAWMATRGDPGRRSDEPSRARGWSGRACLWILLPVSLLATAATWWPSLASTPYHQSVFYQVGSALRGSAPVDTSEFDGLADGELQAVYHQLTGAPEPRADEPLFGRAEGSDVIVWVCETGPAELLSLTGELEDFPTLRRLREHAFVGERHHTTYPYSNRAIFSLLSSIYPSSLTRSFHQQLPDRRVPALPRLLGEAGYARVIYSPDPLTFEDDEGMYRALGVDRFVYPSDEVVSGPDGDDVRVRDEAVLAQLEQDVERWVGAGERYLAVILPQIGHAPWRDVSESGDLASVKDRGRAILALQDRWLGRIVDQLERLGRLDRTLVVFTSDHGVRTRREDPTFHGGRLDAYSYHVPLMLHAPAALDATRSVPWLTSHVDVSPTLLALLGVESPIPLQGSPLWDERLAERTTFFFGNHYFGTDGYHRDGTMVMRDHMAGLVYATEGPLRFGDDDMVARDSPVRGEATATIRRMVSLQQTWVRRFGGRGLDGWAASDDAQASGLVLGAGAASDPSGEP